MMGHFILNLVIFANILLICKYAIILMAINIHQLKFNQRHEMQYL